MKKLKDNWFVLNIGIGIGIFGHSMYAHTLINQFDAVYAHGYLIGPLWALTNYILWLAFCKNKRECNCGEIFDRTKWTCTD